MEKQNIENQTKTSSPLISIIVPVYKVEQYLYECVDSVLSQTFTDFEVILVDDGSPDNCPKICDEYAEKDFRVKIIHKKNGGLSDARNAGIKSAMGEYLVFVDSDDKLVNDFCLADLAKEIQRTKLKLYYLNNIVSDLPEKFETVPSKVIKRNSFMKGIINNSFKRPCAWAWACKRDFIIDNQLCFYKGILHEDEEWLPRLLLALDENDEILVFNNYFYFYRLNRDGSISQVIKTKNVEDKLFIIKRIIDQTKSYGGFDKKFLVTRAAQILTFVLTQGKNVLKKDKKLMSMVKTKISLLWKSTKIKHKIYYIAFKLGIMR